MYILIDKKYKKTRLHEYLSKNQNFHVNIKKKIMGSSVQIFSKMCRIALKYRESSENKKFNLKLMPMYVY